MADAPADVLVPVPTRGRTFTASRLVRFGDMSPGGRLRFDAIARYMQDVSGDDSADSGQGADAPWVVRRLAIEIHHNAGFREPLDLTTWCSGWGPRWAERRVSITGERDARIEGAVLWVYVDLETGVPRRLPDEFFDVYEEATGGRRVRAKLAHDPTVPACERRPWQLRFADFDPFDHVNNAVYFEVVEEELARRRDIRAPMRAEVEYRAALEQGHHVEVVSRDDGDEGDGRRDGDEGDGGGGGVEGDGGDGGGVEGDDRHDDDAGGTGGGGVSFWLVDGDSDDPAAPEVLATGRIRAL